MEQHNQVRIQAPEVARAEHAVKGVGLCVRVSRLQYERLSSRRSIELRHTGDRKFCQQEAQLSKA